MSCQAQVVVVKSTGSPVRLLRSSDGELDARRCGGEWSKNEYEARRQPKADAATRDSGSRPIHADIPAMGLRPHRACSVRRQATTRSQSSMPSTIPPPLGDLAHFRQQYGIWPCGSTASDTECQTQITSNGIFQEYNQSGQAIDQTGDSGVVPKAESTAQEPYDPQPGSWEVEESLDMDAVSAFCNQCKNRAGRSQTRERVNRRPCPRRWSSSAPHPDINTNLEFADQTAGQDMAPIRFR